MGNYFPKFDMGTYRVLLGQTMSEYNKITSSFKVLLLEAPYSYGSGEKLVNKYFPLGIGYLASYLLKAGYSVKILESFSFDSLDSTMNSFAPDLIGISVMTPSYPGAVEICSHIKKRYSAKTVIGGHHVSALKGDVLKQADDIDFAVYGEGEETLLDLVNHLESSTPGFEHIEGLIWRNDNQIITNEPRELLKDLDSIPFPSRSLVDMSQYGSHSYIDFGKKTATLITSRGCPYCCAFCSSWLTMGKGYRFRSTENVMSEIKYLIDEYGIDHFVFEDDTMTLNKKRLLEICEGFKKLPMKTSWYSLSRVDSIDDHIAREMKASGCQMINFGIESGNPEILKKIGKRISIDQAVKAVKSCKKAGLRTQCTFIVGFPYDTEETIKQTYKAAKLISPTIAIFFPLTPYPGTHFFNNYMPEELIPETVDEWKSYTMTGMKLPISLNEHYSGIQIRKLAQRYNRKFYSRPTQWFRILRTLGSIKQLVRMFKCAIYVFFQK